MSELVRLDDEGTVLGRYCVKCWEYKDAHHFLFDMRSKYYITSNCKECQALEKRFLYSQNRDHELKRTRKYQKKHPDAMYKIKRKHYIKNQGMKELEELSKFLKTKDEE